MFSGYDNDMDIDSPFRPPAVIACFNELYRCQPASGLPASNPLRHTLDYCGKIILPQSALEQLSNYNIEYPMIFKITNDKTGLSSHCGVLEFSAKEGVTFIPGWLMETLGLKEGDFVEISNTRLQKGKLIKVQPQSPDFLEITDPRAVLEFTLRQFTTLSPNDCFWINYADHIFKVKILETEPDSHGISVIETDLNVDFAAPVGYIEPDYSKKAISTQKSIANSLGASLQYDFSPKSSSGPFSGAGQSLRSNSSGPRSPSTTPTTSNNSIELDPSRPVALKLPKNTMFFGVTPVKKEETPANQDDNNKKPAPAFQGKGRSLR